jgi:hypothetical protein
MSLSQEQLDELFASFGAAPEAVAGLGLEAALACCGSFNGVCAAEEVFAGRLLEFDAAAHFADLVVECDLVDSVEHWVICTEAFRQAFDLTMRDLREGAHDGDWS